MAFESINPATGQSTATFDNATANQIDAAIERLHRGQTQWRSTPIDHRSKQLRRLADRLLDDRDDHAALITAEMGKPIAQSESEIEFCAAILRYYADHAAEVLADRRLHHSERDAMVTHDPIGVLLGVMPWNFPFYQVIRLVAPNLMVGNTMLIKHAENTPRCAAAATGLFESVLDDHRVVSNVYAPVDRVESIIADRRIRGVSLTGSNRAGSAVAAIAGRFVKPLVLELGGNDPMILCDDVDLDEVVPIAADARLVNSGQSCIAAKRFIVAESIAGAFTDRLATEFAAVRVGDPMDREVRVGPLSSAAARDGLANLVDRSVNAGSRLVCGGHRIDRPGYFYEPTILSPIAPDDPTMDEEFFGPVARVFVATDDDDAVRIANASRYGLGGSVFSADAERASRIARRIESGMVFVNARCRSSQEIPFGGTKDSGYGRELGDAALLQFVNAKVVVGRGEEDEE